MKLLHRFMAASFLRYFGASLGLFALLVFVIFVFDRLTTLLRTDAPAPVVLWYLALQVPYWTSQVVPVATLLATLLCVTELVRSGEWIGLLASGHRPAQALAPVALCVLGIVGLAFLAQETVFPYCSREVRRLYDEEIAKKPPKRWYSDVVLLSGPGEFLMARRFDSEQGRLYNVQLETHGAGRTQLAALTGEWDGGRWVFRDGVRRRFEPGTLAAAEEAPFAEWRSELAVAPSELLPEEREADELSLREALRHRRRLARLGAATDKAATAIHVKLAQPFANLVIFALGIPFALAIRRGGRALCFAGALVVGFAYWWGLSMAQTMGAAGRLPPWAAAWAGNLLFGAAAAVGLKRIRV